MNMHERKAIDSGLAATALFWTALLLFAALRSDYSHMTKAVSELGVLGESNALAWNIIGFIVPGLLLARCGAALAFAVDGRRSMLWWLLVLAALCFALTGVFPAEMSAEGTPLMNSNFTRAHLIVSALSPLFWLPAAFLFIRRAGRNPNWNASRPIIAALAVICTVGFIGNTFFAAALVPSLQRMPGLIQRTGFGLYFLWYVGMTLHLVYATRRVQSAPEHAGNAAPVASR